MLMNLCVFLVLLIAPSSLGVTVTLEGGASGQVNKEIQIGLPVTLFCSYTAGPQVASDAKRVISWLYRTSLNAPPIYIIYDQSFPSPELAQRYAFVQPNSLQIKQTQKSDAGFYECSVEIPTDNPGKDIGTYNLTVIIPPSKPSCKYTSDLALTLGFSAEFKCSSVEGIPAPTYKWYKNGQLLPLNGQADSRYLNTSYSYNSVTGTLTFSKVTTADAGTYFCEASNKLGSETCNPAVIKTKDQDVGMIVGIVFACIFGVLLIGVLVWWTWRQGYCDGFTGKHDDDDDVDADDANDIILDGNGPMVNKPPSEFNGSTGKPEAKPLNEPKDFGGVRVMP